MGVNHEIISITYTSYIFTHILRVYTISAEDKTVKKNFFNTICTTFLHHRWLLFCVFSVFAFEEDPHLARQACIFVLGSNVHNRCRWSEVIFFLADYKKLDIYTQHNKIYKNRAWEQKPLVLMLHCMATNCMLNKNTQENSKNLKEKQKNKKKKKRKRCNKMLVKIAKH